MKRLALLIIATVVAASIPIVAFAQGYPGYNPYATLPPRLQPRGPDMLMVDPHGGPPMGPPPGPMGPPPCMPMMPGCKSERMLGPTAAYLGYLTHGDAVDFRLTYHDVPLGADLRQTYRLNGLWFGASQSFPAGDNLQFLFKGSWFLPLGENGAGNRSDEVYTALLGRRSWDTSPQWWNLDASGAYLLLPSAAAIGGFRFDSFQTVFKDPTNVNGIASLGSDRADVNLTAYMPYLGVLASYATCNGSTTGSIIGFPAVMGYFSYSEHFGAAGILWHARGPFDAGSSYFWEASLEQAFKIGENGSIAVFGKWNALNVKGRPKLEVTNQAGGYNEEPYDLSLDRKVFIIGARVQFDFASR